MIVSARRDNILDVTNIMDVERVRTALEDLCEPLHDVFCWADLQAAERMPELGDRGTYGWYATHTVRALAHYKLAQDRSWRPEFTLSGNRARNGELWFERMVSIALVSCTLCRTNRCRPRV